MHARHSAVTTQVAQLSATSSMRKLEDHQWQGSASVQSSQTAFKTILSAVLLANVKYWGVINVDRHEVAPEHTTLWAARERCHRSCSVPRAAIHRISSVLRPPEASGEREKVHDCSMTDGALLGRPDGCFALVLLFCTPAYLTGNRKQQEASSTRKRSGGAAVTPVPRRDICGN